MEKETPLPAIGSHAVHKDDYAKTTGPVWRVAGHTREGKVHNVDLEPAKNHKLNVGKVLPTKKPVPIKEFQDDYKLL